MPALVLLNTKKSTVVPFTGSFTDEDVDEYLERLLAGGSRRAFKISKIPELSGASNEQKKEL